ncbi:recombination regulator RecX [soil metagenome]
MKNKSSLYQSAIHILTYREHSRQELKRKLLAKIPDDAEIEILLDKLADLELQSDDRFTQAYIHMRRNRGYGPVRIRAELRERGISAELINSHLNEYDPQWQELAEQAVIKKFGNAPSQDYAERVRQARFLQYRGFKM